ncbi:hypothetical protein DL546_006712 [Coniochaeta pulveracea]|uniref:Cytochrome c oxidase assembly protein cox18, mitochondrial n=1 Tax=Coniochaeta pulveracea TaxID=177199 RepID=A0A420YGH1_9PEZI|nr:hypothetical protein DL546_006712 [Coniochaeta pulveracea]
MAPLSLVGMEASLAVRLHHIHILPRAFNSHTLYGQLLRTGQLGRTIPGNQRNFSVAPAIDVAVSGIQSAITNLHVITYTPWYITIPLVALGVNALKLPLYSWSRGLLQKQQDVTPLIMAWRERHSVETAPQIKTLGSAGWQALHRRKTEETRRRLYRALGLQTWKHYVSSLAIFPIWLGVIEALRRMSGGPSGILGLIQQAWSGEKAVDVATSAAVAKAPDAEPPVGSETAMLESPDVVSAGAAAPAADTVAVPDALGFDPSLSTGGCLWFPDLTVADPFHVLPVMLSTVLLVNLLPGSMAQFKQLFNMTPTPAQQVSPWPFRLRRALVMLALAVGPLTMNLPAAIHLYWISSTSISMALTKVVDQLKPIRPVQIRPCTRRTHHIIAHPPSSSKPPPAQKAPRTNTRTAKKI